MRDLLQREQTGEKSTLGLTAGDRPKPFRDDRPMTTGHGSNAGTGVAPDHIQQFSTGAEQMSLPATQQGHTDQGGWRSRLVAVASNTGMSDLDRWDQNQKAVKNAQ